MKPEICVEVYLKGYEMRWKDQDKTQKGALYPPIVNTWLPLDECSSALFKVGRRSFILSVERVRRVKRGRFQK